MSKVSNQILDRNREPVQQAHRWLRIERAARCIARVGIEESPGVHRGFALGNALETVFEQRYRGDLSRRQLACRSGCVQKIQVPHLSRSFCAHRFSDAQCLLLRWVRRAGDRNQCAGDASLSTGSSTLQRSKA